MKRILIFAVIISLPPLLFGTVAVAAPAAAVAGPDAQRISEVSLFKNGLGYFTLSGRLPASLPASESIALIEPILAPAHGTYWFHHNPTELQIRSLTAATKSHSSRRAASSLAELLAANAGRDVEITTASSTRRGRVIALLPNALALGASAGPDIMGRDIPAPAPVSSGMFDSPTVLVFGDEKEQEAIRIDSISAVRSANGLDTMVSWSSDKPEIKLDYAAAADASYAITFLAKGITWAPAYALDISDSPLGRLRLQSIVLNEAADLDHVKLDFISGFPNLMFSDLVSPFSMDQSLSSFISGLGGSTSSSRRGGMMAQQSIMYNARSSFAPEMEEPTDYSSSVAGSYAEDLFYYSLDDVTLAKGSRGYYELLSGPVSYDHIYTWKISNAGPAYRGDGSRPQGNEASEEVWHQILVRNPFDQPLTTAPVLIVSNGKILGQDILNYTSAKSETRIRITKALDIRAERSEAEVNRQHGARTYEGSSYDLVTIEGVLTIRSHKREGAMLEISREFEGELIDAAMGAKETKLAEGLRQLNPTTRLDWRVNLPAQERIEIKYRYKVFVR